MQLPLPELQTTLEALDLIYQLSHKCQELRSSYRRRRYNIMSLHRESMSNQVGLQLREAILLALASLQEQAPLKGSYHEPKHQHTDMASPMPLRSSLGPLGAASTQFEDPVGHNLLVQRGELPHKIFTEGLLLFLSSLELELLRYRKSRNSSKAP